MSDRISPTPWEACGNIVRDADSIEVCEVALWQKEPAKVARLIAAAPDLLEACEEKVGYFCDAAYGPQLKRDNSRVAPLIAAIAKARGEQA